MSNLHPKSMQATRVIFAFAFLLMASLATFGQSESGRISGFAKDQNGAIVPGAAITAKNVRTGEQRTATSNEDGYYLIPALRASAYTITASAKDLSAQVENANVNVGQELVINLALAPTGLSAVVNIVSGEEVITGNGSAVMSANVNQREVQGLPVNGRQLSQLYLQAPGSVNSGSGTFGDIRFSGRAVEQNIVRYDGVEGTAIIDASPGNLNGEIPTPFRLQSSLENVQEFRVDSN